MLLVVHSSLRRTRKFLNPNHYLLVTYVTAALSLVSLSALNAAQSASSQYYFAGHWIQDCPTNDDREFDNRPRIKRTTGIPRSFLKPVDSPEGASQGVMVTPEGGFVIAQPDV